MKKFVHGGYIIFSEATAVHLNINKYFVLAPNIYHVCKFAGSIFKYNGMAYGRVKYNVYTHFLDSLF